MNSKVDWNKWEMCEECFALMSHRLDKVRLDDFLIFSDTHPYCCSDPLLRPRSALIPASSYSKEVGMLSLASELESYVSHNPEWEPLELHAEVASHPQPLISNLTNPQSHVSASPRGHIISTHYYPRDAGRFSPVTFSALKKSRCGPKILGRFGPAGRFGPNITQPNLTNIT